MKKFNVEKTIRDNNGNPLKNNIVGSVTAYTFTEAMRKAVEKFNNGNWANISVKIKK